MTVKISWWPLAIVHYSDNVAVGKGGWAKLMYTRIKTKYLTNGDTGILKHELEHVKQFWLCLGISLCLFSLFYLILNQVKVTDQLYSNTLLAGAFPFLFVVHNVFYTVSETYRLHCEAKAYAVQLHEYGAKECTDKIAGYLVNGYNLDLNEQTAKICINEYLTVLNK